MERLSFYNRLIEHSRDQLWYKNQEKKLLLEGFWLQFDRPPESYPRTQVRGGNPNKKTFLCFERSKSFSANKAFDPS